MRLNVPNIPNNLVLLMSFATATSAAGHWQVSRGRRLKKKEDELEDSLHRESGEESDADQDEPLTLSEKFKTLIMVDSGKGVYEPSIPEAILVTKRRDRKQMSFFILGPLF